MNKSFFNLGIPEHLPIRDVIWKYCGVEINHKSLDEIFEELQKIYTVSRSNLQPTYAQFSSYRLYLRYEYFKKKILELPHWLDEEKAHWKETVIFNFK
jgi:hypothetical protein